MSSVLPDTWVATPARGRAAALSPARAPAPPSSPPSPAPDPAVAPATEPPPAVPSAADERKGRHRRAATWGRLAMAFASSAIIGFIVASALVLAVPNLFGYRTFTVLSGSMEPTLHVGDLVVDKTISPEDLRVGDIVTFRSPSDSHELITHRVRHVEVADGVVYVRTKGDANNTVERWSVSANGSVGVVEFSLRGVGYFLVWARSRAGRLALVILPAVLLGAYELVRIWRPRPKRRSA